MDWCGRHGGVHTCRGPTMASSAGRRRTTSGCTDFKGHFAVGDKTRCHPLTISDEGESVPAWRESLVAPRHELVVPHFEMAFREFGLPGAIRSDNGAPFASAALGRPVEAVGVVDLASASDRCESLRGNRSRTAWHERMHRTLKAETTKPAASNLVEQQRVFDQRRAEFNDERPHEALDLKPPTKVYTVSRRAMPATPREPEYGDGEVRRCDNAGRAGCCAGFASSSGPFWRTRTLCCNRRRGRGGVPLWPGLLAWVD